MTRRRSSADPAEFALLAEMTPTVDAQDGFRLDDFPCPLCHRPVTATETHGMLSVPRHPVLTPVFPFGHAGPMYHAECPASLMQLTPVCDETHPPPPCDDRACWQLPSRTLAARIAEQSWDADEDTRESPAYAGAAQVPT